MSMYNFKKILTVPAAKDFVDFTLSKTQRKTPTVVHKQYKLSRIRRFYMRKVRYTQDNFHERLKRILTDFPNLEDMHPFYADLLNTLYNKDHYKLSLGQLNIALHLIDKVSVDYVKLLKYADSLYRCKQLKRSALGRMATIVKKQAPGLKYLEEVRQHMSRLPSIDPNARTLILCGCPNAGKSSFINLITRANVEVQPYAFTTKSLYVGHTDYEFLRWQVIDTPGILDRPFDEMNTIELQAITALAHIRAAVIFIMDISEQCNVPIDQQMKIYDSIKPLFANKPLIVACNKTDIVSLDELEKNDPEKRELITGIEKDGVSIFEMSTLTQTGVMEIKKEACNRLLTQRVEMKLRSRKADSILNRIHVAEPIKRDNRERKPFIPEAVKLQKEKMDMEEDALGKPKKKLEKDLQEELDIDYSLDLNKTKLLDDQNWNYDAIPQFMNGLNIADYIDPEILEKLETLENEDEEFMKAGVYNLTPEAYTDSEQALIQFAKQITDRLAIMAMHKSMNKSQNRAPVPRPSRKRERERSVSKLRTQLSNLGVDMSDTKDAHFTRTGSMDRSTSRPPAKKNRADSQGRSLSVTRPPRDQSGVRDAQMLNKVKKMEKRAQLTFTKGLKGQRKAHKADSDRKIIDRKPKHLFSGKRGTGKTDRR